MLDCLTKRFSEAKICVLGTLLDPRYKALAFASEETLEKGKKLLKEEAEELAILKEEDPCPPLEGPEQDEGLDPETKKQKIHQPTLMGTLYARVLGAIAVSREMYSFETELECYLSGPVTERSDMPLQ